MFKKADFVEQPFISTAERPEDITFRVFANDSFEDVRVEYDHCTKGKTQLIFVFNNV